MHIKTPADTTATIAVSVCPRCGTIGKSGKPSCCGRGGAWFKNCGGAGNAKLDHSWYEGIQACKARSQSKTVVGNQLNGAQQKGIDSSQGADRTNAKSIIAATKTFVFTSVNTSRPMSVTTSIVTPVYTADDVSITTSSHTSTSTHTLMTSSTHTSASTSIIKRGCVNVLKIIVHINLLFLTVI